MDVRRPGEVSAVRGGTGDGRWPTGSSWSLTSPGWAAISPVCGQLLDGPLAGLFGAVHLVSLPLPPDPADEPGADVTAVVGAEVGADVTAGVGVDLTADLAALVRDYDIMVDVQVNDVPADSAAFLDWLDRGAASAFDGLFLTLGSVFPSGVAESDLARLHLPGPGVPFSVYAGGDGTARVVWTTFGPRRIDVDVRHPEARRRLQRALDRVAARGVRRVRLADAGYVAKAAGSSSFWIQDTLTFLGEAAAWCRARGLRCTVDLPADPALRRDVAALVDDVPDGEPARLVADALRTGDGGALATWLQGRPADASDLLAVIDTAIRIPFGTATQSGIDDAARLPLDHDRLLLAHALQLWAPGRPQVSGAALIAAGDSWSTASLDRDALPHSRSRADVETALKQPAAAALLRLVRFRADHPAFHGGLTVSAAGADLLVSWAAGADIAELDADLETGEAAVRFTRQGRRMSAPLDRLP